MAEPESGTPEEAATGNVSQAPSEAPYPSTFYAWYCVFVLLGIYLNSFLDRSIIGLLVGPIKETMDLSDTSIGLLQGPAFALFYVIAGLPLGWLADRMSRRTLIIVGQVFWSLASVAFGLGRNFSHLLGARVGVGMGEASLSPSAYSLIADLFPPWKLGRALSVYSTGIYLGGGLASVIGGQLAAMYAPAELHSVPIFGERYGWQIVFFFVALPTIPLTLLLLTMREPARRGLGKRRDADGTLQTIAVPISDFLSYWWKIRRATVTHAVGFGALSFLGYGAAAWLPEFFIRSHGWTRAEAGTFLGLNAMAGGPAGLICAGMIADRWSARGVTDAKMRVGLLGACLWLPFGIAVPLLPGGQLSFLALIPANFFAAWSWGVAPAALQEILPNQMRGQGSAMYLFILSFIGLGLGPVVLPLITDYVFQDDSQIHLSLLTTTVSAAIVAIVLLGIGLAPFRAARERLATW